MKRTIIIFVFILLLAAFLRFYYLDNRPAHFDEGGGHAIGVRALMNEKRYIYDPDFHGPFLYHITALAFILFGMSDITLRITQALLGFLTVCLLWLVRNHVKRETLIAGVLLLSLSPSLVYYSRFAVHDSYFIFFSMAFIVFLFLYSKEKKDLYIYLTSASIAFLFTVKENAFIFLGVIGIYFLAEFLIELLKTKGNLGKKIQKNLYVIWLKQNLKQIFVSIVIFAIIISAIYSSFFRYPSNITKFITEPFKHWLRKSTEQSGFVQPYEFYLRILREYDTAVFLFGLAGIFMPFIANNKYTRFASIFGLLNMLIYLFMPYKEPNNVVHIVLPLAVSAISFFEFSNKKIARYSFILLLLISLYSIYITWQTSFVRYSDEKNYLVYVQTVDDIKPMLKLMEKLTKERGKDIPILVNIPETEYPLSWYFRDYTNVEYRSENIESPIGWKNIRWSGDGKIIWDDKEYKSGSKSGKIDGGNGTDGEWRQKIAVQGGRYYTISGWIKTVDLQPIDSFKYAQLYIRTDKNNEPDTIIAETQSLTGTNNWTFVQKRFYVDQNVNWLWLTMPIGNWGKSKGQVWFDDIELKADGDFLNLIQNPGFEDGKRISDIKGYEVMIISESNGLSFNEIEGYNLS
ncbi:MAG: TIGR03663 family protein, partial [Candidatus Aenigmatarchaeota archaeon]